MGKDKFSAIWISHSSIKDYLNCPQAYFLKNVYKNPRTNRKISLMKPSLALGHVVHTVIDEVSALPTQERLATPLIDRFNTLWTSVEGKKGGFRTSDEEKDYKNRGTLMMTRITKNPGPLVRKAIRLKDDLPYFWLSEEDDVILCGKVDWLEFIEEDNSIGIIDFKTGKSDEKDDSLQLPIYYLLVKSCQSRPISAISYWYLDRDNSPIKLNLPDEQIAKKKITTIAERIKLARQLNHFKCSRNEIEGCIHCAPFKAIISGRGTFVGIGQYNEEVYILPDSSVSF